MDLFKKSIAYGIGCGVGIIGMVGVCIASFNLGTYNGRKSYLINEAIRGRESEALTLIEKNRNEEKSFYKTSLEKVLDSDVFGGFGEKQAEKRFKSGKFDDIIREYRPDYHNNS